MTTLLATPALTSLRDAIGATLAAVPDLGLVAFGYIPSTAGTGFPVGFVEVTASEQLGQFHTWTQTDLTVYVMFGEAGSQQDAQEALDRSQIGTAAISKALRSDPTFGGACVTSAIRGQATPIFREMAGIGSWGLMWDLQTISEA